MTNILVMAASSAASAFDAGENANMQSITMADPGFMVLLPNPPVVRKGHCDDSISA